MKLGKFSIGVGIVVVLLGVGILAHALLTTSRPRDPDAPPGDPTAWHEIFKDDFSGPGLDSIKWNTCYWWANGPTGCGGANGELERYLPQNVIVHDHVLDLQALNHAVTINAKTYPYTSGMVTTEGKFHFRYGYMEAHLQIPQGQGYWPAFWSLAQDHTTPTELDAMEVLGNDPRTIHVGVYYKTPAGTSNHAGDSQRGPDLSAGFYTIGVDWEPTHITWYLNGIAQQTQLDPAKVPQRDLYLILNLAVGGTWPGAPNGTTPFPGHLLVKWVRVWQHGPQQGSPSTG